jgi:hypothetical protein
LFTRNPETTDDRQDERDGNTKWVNLPAAHCTLLTTDKLTRDNKGRIKDK